MKVIDLLNKIANGEEVPQKIKYEKDIYKHIDNYCYYCDETNLILSDRIFAEYSKLNAEVEILEEEKKIPEKLGKYADVSGDLACEWTFGEKRLKDKINEIIDCLDYFKSKGE